MNHFPVIVDHRERQSGLIEALAEHEELALQRHWLPYGDLIVSDITIERKTTADFARSLRDGRLFRQLSALDAFSKRRLLILEGIGMPYEVRLSENAFNAALLKASAIMQIPILRTTSLLDTVQCVVQLARQESAGAERKLKARRPRGMRANRPPPQCKVLRAIPQVSMGQTELLLRSFKTVQNVFNATREQLATVKGLDPQSAENVFRVGSSDWIEEEGRERLDPEAGE